MVNPFKEDFNESLPEKVAKYILEEMFAGNLKQGDRLIESNIAKKLNISHAPVREALYILEMQNVVERFPRKGVRIRVISDKEIRDYIEALIGIVQLSCKLIENWSEDKYLQLKEIYMAAQKKMENGNIRDYILTVAQFFTVFVSFTNNTVFQHFTSEILFVTNVFAKTNWSQKLIQKFQMHLKAGLEAIKDEDFEKASEKLSQTLWITLEKSN